VEAHPPYSRPTVSIYQTICTYSRRSRAARPANSKAKFFVDPYRVSRCPFNSSIDDALNRCAFSFSVMALLLICS
jgi:hypothetical protein